VAAGRPETFVKKIAQNVAQYKNYLQLTAEDSSPKFWASTVCNFQTAQSNQSSNTYMFIGENSLPLSAKVAI
jgi:hypothetical protein